MPDTGAPWNIPYVAPSDLVRDYPSDSEDLADAIAAGLSAAGNPGIGSNVVQTVKTDTFTTSSSSFTDITGLTVNITPTTNTSKVLIIAQVAHSFANASNGWGHFVLTRGTTQILEGDAASSRIQATFGGFTASDIQSLLTLSTIVYLDSPATTSSTQYRVRARQAGFGSVFVNRSFGDGDSAASARGASTITAIEVAP